MAAIGDGSDAKMRSVLMIASGASSFPPVVGLKLTGSLVSERTGNDEGMAVVECVFMRNQ